MSYIKKNKIKESFSIENNISEGKGIKGEAGREISFMKALMDNLPDSIYFKDKNSRFVKINKATAKKMGLKTPGEAIGKTDFDFFSEVEGRLY